MRLTTGKPQKNGFTAASLLRGVKNSMSDPGASQRGEGLKGEQLSWPVRSDLLPHGSQRLPEP